MLAYADDKRAHAPIMTREGEQRLEMRLDAIVDEITALLGGDEDRALQTILRAAATGFDLRVARTSAL